MKPVTNLTANIGLVILLALTLSGSDVKAYSTIGTKTGGFAVPTQSQTAIPPRLPFEDLNYISRWITLEGLFDNSNKGYDHPQRYYNAINQWIVLNALFGSGLSDTNFNRLDPISQWIILEGLFGDGHINDRYNDISQWIVLNAMFRPSAY